MRLRRGERDGEFVIQAAVGVAQHLILVHHQQRRAVAFDKPALLRFECGNQDRRVEILREVAGGDADIPAARAPFGEFVVRQGASWHRVNRLTVVFSVVRPQLENERLARARRRLHHDVLALAQRGDRLLLPEVGHHHLVQGGQTFELFRERRHAGKITEDGKCETGKFGNIDNPLALLSEGGGGLGHDESAPTDSGQGAPAS